MSPVKKNIFEKVHENFAFFHEKLACP